MKFSALALPALALASKVVVLTKESFPKFIKENDVSLIEFYAPWCGHCKALAPEYDAASIELDGIVKIAKVDCTVEESVCTEQGVEGFPTLKVFRNGKSSAYSGERTSRSIVEVMKKQMAPTITLVTDATFKEFKDSARVVVIGKGKKDTDEYIVFEEVAESMRDNIAFGFQESDESSYTLYKKFDEKMNKYEGEMTLSEFSEFLTERSRPLMDDIGPQNYEAIMSVGKPVGFFFHSSDAEKAKHGPIFEKIAKAHQKDLIFVYLDATKFSGFADVLALKQEWPAFGIQNPAKNEKFPFDQSKPFTEENLAKFVKGVVDGTIESTIKSEPIPEKNDGPVTVVVAKEFQKIVMDKNTDVFVEFYAPWCGHCKKLAPVWEELGVKVTSPLITIAKCDTTANDVPVQIQGFPTLILFKAGTKEQVPFEGDRSLEAMLKFLKENAVNGAYISLDTKEAAPETEAEEEVGGEL